MRRQQPWRQQSTPIAALGLLPEAIEAGMVVLPGAHYRAVLETTALGVGMLSDDAAEALEARYHRFLAGLAFPLQIIMRAQCADAGPYRARLHACLTEEADPALLRLLVAQVAHLDRLLAVSAPLERHFYVIVPAPDAPPTATRPRFWLGAQGRQQGGSGDRHTVAREGLRRNCHLVAGGLRDLGLEARRLGSTELAALWYGWLCPQTARRQPLQGGMLDAVGLPLVRRAAGGGHHALASS